MRVPPKKNSGHPTPMSAVTKFEVWIKIRGRKKLSYLIFPYLIFPTGSQYFVNNRNPLVFVSVDEKETTSSESSECGAMT